MSLETEIVDIPSEIDDIRKSDYSVFTMEWLFEQKLKTEVLHT